MIRPVTLEDAAALADIYNYYILNAIATFEEVPIDAAEMKKRIVHKTALLPWIVYEQDNQVIGYAYSGQWNTRTAYKHSAETTVYLKHDVTQKGIGTQLYTHLIEELKAMNFHTVIGGISLPNAASVALHEKLGYTKTAHYKEVGFKFGKWIDVGYWQLMIRKNS